MALLVNQIPIYCIIKYGKEELRNNDVFVSVEEHVFNESTKEHFSQERINNRGKSASSSIPQKRPKPVKRKMKDVASCINELNTLASFLLIILIHLNMSLKFLVAKFSNGF
ncbi:hypothetical protein RN001_012036 [Aquatica leii]|uniref:Uncharacterized protein n=1 Tax=Aquatica leii TaxID=1421715 RepID=A0AAN7PSH8_9COLE|nr:hypothetical protein RN001_012036 [Aquatica leii]